MRRIRLEAGDDELGFLVVEGRRAVHRAGAVEIRRGGLDAVGVGGDRVPGNGHRGVMHVHDRRIPDGVGQRPRRGKLVVGSFYAVVVDAGDAEVIGGVGFQAG